MIARTFVRVGAVLFVATVITTAIARANPPALTPELPMPKPPERVESYRAEVILADLLAVSFLAYSASSSITRDSTETLQQLSAATYFFGAPFMHAMHGRGNQVFASLGIRAGLLVGSVIVGAIVVSPTEGQHDDEILVGFIVAGGIGAAILDAKYLAKGTDPPKPAWQPTVARSSHGITFGVARTF